MDESPPPTFHPWTKGSDLDGSSDESSAIPQAACSPSVPCYNPPMPSNGAYTLSEGPARIIIHCDTCGRHGEYSRDRAIARLGDIALPTFLWGTVAAVCARKRDITTFGGCGAGFVWPDAKR